MVKFAHMSDCHLGSWSNHPDMRDYPILAFESAINECIREKVDFIIVAGDLFDTSLPAIDVIRRTATIFRKCKEAGIGVYVVQGSHDYSPTGKTMMSVLEEAGLLVDVCKYDEEDGKIRLRIATDPKTGVKFTGLMGKKGGLDANYYKRLDKSIENEKGPKIFVFHAGIAEYMPGNIKDIIAVSLNDLPKGFDYYATGHIHNQVFHKEHKIVFPGELFPTSFDELEDYNGGYAIVNLSAEGVDVKFRNSRIFDVALMKFDVTGKSVAAISAELMKKIESTVLKGRVLLIKLSGTLENGKITDIDFNHMSAVARERGAKVVKRSISAVLSKEFQEVDSQQFMSTDEIERTLIGQRAEYLKLHGVNNVEDFVLNLMNILKDEKQEDETTATFEERIKSAAKNAVGL